MSLQRIVIGLSGGVDSAVAAYLLRKQGHEVEALFMKNWEEDDRDGFCAASSDLEDAERICEQLNIELHTVNFSAEYWDQVFEYFIDEHKQGRTPNPDIACNTNIKFHHFYEHARQLGADRIATGHYANIRPIHAEFSLHTSADQDKDQTYFLHGLNQQQLSRSLFPLGYHLKRDVRRLASDLDLHVHSKKDSTGICFIGERRFQTFLQRYIPTCPGNIIDPQGNIVGQHQGVSFYTIGQRQGLGIGGSRKGSEEPWYVIDKNTCRNELVVAQGSDHPGLYHRILVTDKAHWIRGFPPHRQLGARIRHRQTIQACTISKLPNGGLQVTFEQPQRAVTPGQYIVFYYAGECLGGAVIHQREHENGL